ncbi:cytochrome P450 (plasmid) [Burkholderia glumae]|uniref:Cytochrome P450 n=1 Tax=Burkholderia glumae TaxID=337 RepID=A0ABY5BFQ3_BURGL|nr:cytochrome P450 [Burkholderia glumae]USS44406.1 cytochrome P450 [Burkholderia glumae]
MTDTILPDLPTRRTCPFDPPPEYRTFRAECPVARVRTPRGDEAWIVTRREDIRAVLTDRRFSSDPTLPGFPTYLTGDIAPPPGFFLLMDSPDHHRLRSVVVDEFKGSKLDALRPLMERVVVRNLDQLAAMTPSVDLIGAFALPVAAQIICEMLGVPYEDHGFVQDRTDTILDRSRAPADQERAVVDLMAYFDRVVSTKEAAPGDDVIGRLIRDPDRYQRIDHRELVGLAALLLLSAYDTMAQVIGLGTVVLLEHRDQLAEFMADPSLSDNFVDELVRYLSVNHAGLPRVATDDVQVGGRLVRRGEGVIVMVNSGNRDESVYQDPDRFDIHRRAKEHVGFGHGLHKCIGAHFARAELAIVFRRLFERLPTLAVAAPVDSLPFRHDMVLYGLKQLPVTWRPTVRDAHAEVAGSELD